MGLLRRSHPSRAAFHDLGRGMCADRSRAPVRFGKSVSILNTLSGRSVSSLSARRFFVENKIAMPLRFSQSYAFFCSFLVLAFALSAQQKESRIACFSDSRFSPPHAAAEHQLESTFQSIPSPQKAREWHRTFTAEPHPAASDRNNQARRFRRGRNGGSRVWEDVTLRRYDVLHSRPRSISLEMTGPVHFNRDSARRCLRRRSGHEKILPSPARTLAIPHRATSPPKSSTRTAAILKITIFFGKTASA